MLNLIETLLNYFELCCIIKLWKGGNMNISWFNKGSVDGIASIYNTNITINKTGSIPFEHAYAAQIGISIDDMCLAIKPLSKDRVDRGDLDKDLVFKLSCGATYTRISSSEFVKEVERTFNLKFTNKPRKFVTRWDANNSLLLIDLSKEVKAA